MKLLKTSNTNQRFRKIEAQAFEAGDFLNIFLRFWDFWGSFSYKNISYKKTCVASAIVSFFLLNFLFLFLVTLILSNTSVLTLQLRLLIRSVNSHVHSKNNGDWDEYQHSSSGSFRPCSKTRCFPFNCFLQPTTIYKY